ncbi:MAG: CocE/NonD family hydrolase [Mycobacteriales bacterium]|nr:CocE/NonD family hydrolase [Mycobacteriales bacterium]
MRLALLLSAAVLTAGVATASPAGALDEFTVTPALVTVTDGPADDHQVDIDTDLYVPVSATAATPQPAMLITHGFGLSKSAPEVVAQASYFARHGYVVLTWTSAGFGGSGGCITLHQADYDGKAARQLVDVLAARPEVLKDARGPVVGTVGGSYGGGGQLVHAGIDDRVRAAAPGRTWNLLQYSLYPNNWVKPGDPTGFSHQLHEQGVFKAQWTTLLFAAGNTQPVGGIPPTGAMNGNCPGDKLSSADPVLVAGTPCVGFTVEVCEVFARIVATGDASAEDRALLGRASAATYVPELDIPVLFVQGQRDTLFNVNDALATYTALKARGKTVKMVWNSGGHGGYTSLPGECEVYGGGTGGEGFAGLEGCYLTSRTLAFFDSALRGKADPFPSFSWHRDWTPEATGASNASQYAAAAAYPAMPSTTFTLSGTDALVTAGATTGSAMFLNPPGGQPAAFTETSNFTGDGTDPRQPSEQPGQSVSFTSEPFATDTESVGVPSATLRLSHVAPTDLVMFGKVYDVAPDGSSELIHRLIAPARIPTAALESPVTIQLLGFAHRFDAGHSVRLTLAATDMTSRNNLVADAITVTTGPGSTFSLPMRAAAAAPPVVTPPAGPPAVPPAAPPAAPSPTLPSTGLPATLPAAAALLVVAGVAVRRRLASH